MSGEELHKPDVAEIQKVDGVETNESVDDFMVRRELNRLNGWKTTRVREMRNVIAEYSKQLDGQEAEVKLGEVGNTPELDKDRQEARRILKELGDKLSEFQGIFNSKGAN